MNSELFFESANDFLRAFERFGAFLDELRRYQERAADRLGNREFVESGDIGRVVYTLQQSIGSVSDSLQDSNQARKRVGQTFEGLIKLIIRQLGLECEQRSIKVPIPDSPGYTMSYQIDVVISRQKAILTSPTEYIYHGELVGSVKTTSKDRLDKIFLDKFLLSRLLGRDVPTVAIFLHDVQRRTSKTNPVGIASTFKTHHFLGRAISKW